GVAVPCIEIHKDPIKAYDYTAKGNFVAVISNGTAVLGLGNLGALASKPVMEGKAVLFKRFADIDAIDIEVSTEDPEEFINSIKYLGASWGGINLEDIKAPECFVIERKLRELMDIPVFHDDQHGTAIIVLAGLINAAYLTNREFKDLKVVVNGAGSAGIACIELIKATGVLHDNVILCDTQGVIYKGRVSGMNEWKEKHSIVTDKRTLEEALIGADVFLGLSVKGAVTKEMVKSMNDKPIIFAMANPDPEITPMDIIEVRDDAIIATGRSDYNNQVNNVMGFPYIFRGALDSGATTINEEMKIACVYAIAKMAHVEPDSSTYGEKAKTFGRDYLIPGPLDPRLILEIAPAVAQAAIDSGVATRPIQDFDAYRQRLSEFVYNSAFLMKPIFAQAKTDPKRIVFCEGEDDRVLRAVQILVDDGLAKPILVGRPAIIEDNIKRQGLRLKAGVNFEMVNQDDDHRYTDFWQHYYKLMQRRGIGVELAKREARRRTTLIGAMLVHFGHADGMICGTFGYYDLHLDYVRDIIGTKPGVNNLYAMNVVMMGDRNLFIADTYVNPEPTAEQLAEMTLLAAEEVRRFGLTPRVALLSHSNFGSANDASAEKMREVFRLLSDLAPELEVEGEMHGDAAIDETIRLEQFPNSRYKGAANLLIMPNLDAANIAFNLLKAAAGNNVTIGPILLGANKPVHVLTPTATSRRIVNMTALTVAEIQHAEKDQSVLAD
ncbi:MAG: NADP-dependent malic enzyme, partial [Pedobacter sp.]